MNIDIMRLLDRQLGLFICRSLAVYGFFRGILTWSKPSSAPRRILIIKLSEMGSTIFAAPAFARIKQRAPDAELYMLVFKRNAHLVRVLKLVPDENIIEVEITSFSALLSSGLKAVAALRRAKIDAVVDMDLFFRVSAVFSFLSGARTRIGFHRFANEGFDRGCLLTRKVVYSTEYHTSVAFMALAESLFDDASEDLLYKGVVDKGLEFPVYKPRDDEVAAMRKHLKGKGLSVDDTGKELIIVAPESASALPVRKWPFESYVELCKKILSDRSAALIVITGARAEKSNADKLSHEIDDKRCHTVAGETDLTELMALYSMASLLITNDGGPGHFASLCSLPSVVMFGPETPRLYSPVGGKAHCIYAGLACSPCLTAYNFKESRCADNVCMQKITVGQVYSTVKDILDGRDA